VGLSQLPQAANPLVDVGVWTSYTPTVTQAATVAITVNHSQYTRIGRTIVWAFELAVTGAGTAGNAVVVTTPVTTVGTGGSRFGLGVAQILDASASTRYVCMIEHGGAAGQFRFIHDTSGGGEFGTAPAITLASGDSIRGQAIFQAAS
jgi:hypothetical protein